MSQALSDAAGIVTEQALLDAAINNSITGLEMKLSSYPSNISQVPPWLITACEWNSIQFVGEILRLRPELAWDESLGDGKAMHDSCEKGNAEIVEILAKRHPKLCHVKDHDQRSAVHIAAKGGKVSVLTALARACPSSLTCLTSRQETGLHVALKNNQLDSFLVLLQELPEQNKKDVLEWKDCDGNTVLHIATSMKQTKILQHLLLNNGINGPMADVNSKNRCGHTAMDIHYQTDQSESSDKLISDVRRAGADNQAAHGETSAKISNKEMRETLVLAEKALFVVLCVLFAGCSYSSLSSFGSAYPPENYGNATVQLGAQDMIFAPNLVPDGFFYILFTSVTFTTSNVWLLIIVFSLNGSWSFNFKLTMPILDSLAFASFALMAKKLVPHFKISFSGSANISSFSLLCFCNLAVIFLCAFSDCNFKRDSRKERRKPLKIFIQFKKHDVLLVIASLLTMLTSQALLSFSRFSLKEGFQQKQRDLILGRWFIFFNSTTFMASLAIVLLVLHDFPLKPWPQLSVSTLFGSYMCAVMAISPSQAVPLLILSAPFLLLAAIGKLYGFSYRN